MADATSRHEPAPMPEDWEDFAHYEGMEGPGYTQTPDFFFDYIAPRLNEAELKIMLFIIRRTFGFKKQDDRISLSQMVEGMKTQQGEILNLGAGVARSSAVRAIKALEAKRLIIATRITSTEKGYEATTYKLRMRV